MIRTPLCELLGIDLPIVLGGMGTGTSPELVAAVSEAGGLGTLGLSARKAEEIPGVIAAVRALTAKPIAVNFLLFLAQEAAFAAALDARPAVIAFAWPRPEQELGSWFDRAHASGAKVMFMVGEVPEARRAVVAGADVIVAQGSEGGGHVGWMGALPLVPMVVDAVSPLPVLAAGGIADGRGLAAALALGAQGALLGTRFLATEESPLHANFKRAILASDGHDTLLSEIPDLVREQVWPGAMARARRNRFIERWAGREWALRAQRHQALAELERAMGAGDAEEAVLLIGQDAGLIDAILPAREVVWRMAAEAEQILAERLPGFLRVAAPGQARA
jgi:nitronate monooxygenase/enoyl-[acyl-carrier protein] reductase II